MTWFKVDDTLAFHRKAVAAGNAAMGLWVRAGSWCSQQLTDGVIPNDMIPALGNAGQAKRLVAVGLWERVEGGYRFWQWNESGRQPTREQVEQDRTAARERMRRVRTGPRSSPERSPEQAKNEQGTSGAVRDPRPVPSRPEGTGVPVDESPPRRNGSTPEEEGAKSAGPKAGIDAVIAEVKTIRPEWSERSIRRALTRPAVAERPPAVVRSAALAVAHDRTSTAPGRLEHDGPWWRLSEPPKPAPAVRPEIWDNLAPLGQRDNDEANSRGRAAVDAEWAKARAAKGGGP